MVITQIRMVILSIDKSQYDEINVDLRTSGFDNEALSVERYVLHDGSSASTFSFFKGNFLTFLRSKEIYKEIILRNLR